MKGAGIMKQRIINYMLLFAVIIFCLGIAHRQGEKKMAHYAANYSREQFYRAMFLTCYVTFSDPDICSQGVRNAIANRWYETDDPIRRTP